MALSQVQCLDDNHINLRTNESKPDFYYSEEQRLALEKLIHEGRDAFEDHVKTNNIRCFLSDLELERILNNVEVYSPGSPDNNAELYGESDGEEVSLHYWPDLSDYSMPRLDIGWPNCASFRGVTRVQVYTQPPYDNQPHIKEVVRKMIGQAQKVVAIVMDLFTDVDIFRDVLDASYRRKVSVYILLESTGVTHFLNMCDKAGMHTGHLKNLRVRSIRGAEFFSRSSKRVCGSQSQKFMFIDGDKAVSGSYSFTWSASRLDRNLITVLTGQTVEIFDSLFQDMYVVSNGVCLSKINLGSEPKPEILPQAVPTLFPTANTAFKLINPKYTLLSGCMSTTNGPDETNAKNVVTKNPKDAPVLPPIHPGLLNLEKANMIHYVPAWPDPEPQSDVIGFINIRDTNKPLQAHLMRSELFEVSQAIRFKDSISEPKQPAMAHPTSHIAAQTQACTEAQSRPEVTERNAEHFHQNQQQESSQREDLISPLQSPPAETMHVLTGNRDDKEAPDVIIKDNLCTDSLDSVLILSFNAKDVSSDAKPALDAPQPLQCPAQTLNNPDVKSPSESNKRYRESYNRLNDQVIIQADVKPVLAVDETHQNGCDTHTSNTDSSLSSLSDYYDCFSPLIDLRSKSEVVIIEKPSDLQSHNQKNILHTATPVTETLNNKSALPNKDGDPAQTRNSDFNFSSTSEEYFECSETIGFDAMANVIDSSSQLKVNDFNQNELHDTVIDSIPAVTLQIQKLTETSMQEDDERRDPESSCQNVTETGSVITVKGHLEANNSESVSGTEHDSQNLHRHQTQEHEVTLDPEVKTFMLPDHTPEMILQQPEKLGTEKIPQLDLQSELSLDFMCVRQSAQIAEKTDKQPDLQLEELRTEKPPLIDLQPEVNLDFTCKGESAEKTEKQQMQLQSKVNLDLMCERQSAQITETPPAIDFQPEVNVHLKCEGKHIQNAENAQKLLKCDLKPELNLDLVCKGQSEQIAEKTEKPAMIDLQPDLNLDVMCGEESVHNAKKTDKQPVIDLQIAELRTEKSPIIDLHPEVNLHLMCEGESAQTAEKTEKPVMRDLLSELNLDLMCGGESVQISSTEKTSFIDFQPDVNLHLMVEGQSAQKDEKNKNQPQLDLQAEVNLDLMCEESVQNAEETKKLLKPNLKPELNLDLMCKGQSEQIAEKTENPPMIDLQPDLNLDLMYEGESVQRDEESENPPMIDLQPDLNLDLMYERVSEQIAEETENPPMIDLQPDLNLDLMYERESLQRDEETGKQQQLDLQPKLDLTCEGRSEKTELKPLIRDLQAKLNLDLTQEGESVEISEKTEKPSIPDFFQILLCTSVLKSSDLNGCKSQTATGVKSLRCSAVQDKAAVTPVKPEKTDVSKSIDLHNSDEQRNLLAHLDWASKHHPNLQSAERVNEIKMWDVEVSPTGLKENPEVISTKENHLKLPEEFETVELLILEDSDLQEIEGTEKNHSDLKKTKTALSTEAKVPKTKPSGLKMVNVRKLTGNQIEVYSKHGKQTCHMTAPVKKKEERERVSAIQVKKYLPEAKPKLDCQVSKQPHQTSSRIPIATKASEETSELHITKPHSMNRSQRHQAPKAETHHHGKPSGRSKPSPCPEKLSTGEMTTHRIKQRHSWTNGFTSSLKQPHVQRPKTTQTDQPVSRKHSGPTVSPSGTSFPRQIKSLKQTFKETSASKTKKDED